MKSSNNPDPPPWPPLPGEPFNPYRRFLAVCVPEQLLASRLVSPGAKLAYAQLARHAGSGGRCFPRQAILAEALGVSERQVRRYIRQLERAGLLRTMRRGLNAPNAYEFLWHEIFEKSPARSR
jgi:DNA-binding transcriptional ArsR family regulator